MLFVKALCIMLVTIRRRKYNVVNISYTYFNNWHGNRAVEEFSPFDESWQLADFPQQGTL